MKLERIFNKSFTTLLILFGGLLSFACDPGIEYSPKDWTKSEDRKFSKSFGSLDVGISPVGGLIGSEYLAPEVTLRNRAKSPAVIESAILKANGAEYLARPFGEASWATIPPNEIRRVTLGWDLGKPLYQVLKDPVEIVLTIRVGGERIEITTPMVKTFG